MTAAAAPLSISPGVGFVHAAVDSLPAVSLRTLQMGMSWSVFLRIAQASS
jgi:hypothetical protein